ncbi:selenide, water dikinase [Lysinibacillus sp. BF-4]|uniref:septation ring formation regulator EzrA n=1 Tax=Lysinibacillus sp. BF-4 TaxID=1473546 RepID=UPI0005051F21|nr:septation ring formation regulator EzrA [Lysinibacillus sp. BF-4]KFL44171.1 selenide, water dikinase [Lysinibacillus sp. BF-4]
MQYIIIPIVILLVIIIVLLQQQRKHRKIMEVLEQQRREMQNKPINEELTKVKALNMNGQTEEMFDRWRGMNDEIKGEYVEVINELLQDIEDNIRGFKFKKATILEEEIKGYLKTASQTQDKIVAELNELIGSEEKNRIEIEELNEKYKAARKTLLAHQHAFGDALPALEERLEAFTPQSEQFKELTDNGNYLEARELVEQLQREAENFLQLIQDIPTLLTDVQTNIPSSLAEIRGGYAEMEGQGYYLRHLELLDAFEQVDEEITVLKKDMKNLELDTIRQRIEDLNETIDYFYDVLENEVMAKQYLDKHCDSMFGKITKLQQSLRHTITEAEYVQESYHLSEEDADVPRECLRQLDLLQKRYDLVAMQVREGKSAYSSLRDELETIDLAVGKIMNIHEEFSRRMKNLRVDEEDARKRLVVIERTLQNTERMLNKANIPGVPAQLQVELEGVAELIYVVHEGLRQVPLDMNDVGQKVEETEQAMANVSEASQQLVEDVLAIERIIQYGNRYRATNQQLDERLTEAERAFVNAQYTKALEEAGAAVEEAEPGALEKVQQMVEADLREL